MSFQSTRLRKPNKVFIIYFVSFFLVILTPVLYLSISSYNMVISIVQEEISQANMNALRQTSSSVDRLLDEINTLSIHLGLDGRVYASSKAPENSYLLNDVKDRIKSLAAENMNVHSIQLYFNKNDLIISSQGVDRYYNHDSFDQWIPAMNDQTSDQLWLPARSFVNHDGNKVSIITMVREIPVAFPNMTGYVAIHLYEKDLISILETTGPYRDHTIYLAKPNKQIITSYSPSSSNTANLSHESLNPIPPPGEEGSYIDESRTNHVMVSYRSLNHLGWTLVYETPLEYLYNKLHYITQVIMITGIILISLGLIVSFFLSRKMYNPIKQLLEKSKRYQEELALPIQDGENTLKYVSGMFEQVVGKHKALEASYKANYQAMVDRFIYNILFNRSNDSFNINEKINYLQLPITDRGYSAMIVEIDDYAVMKDNYSIEDLNLFRFALSNIIQEVINQSYSCLCTETNDHQIAILINTNGKEDHLKNNIKKLGEQLIKNVINYLKFSITISVGEHIDHITQAHLSFSQASNVIRYKILSGHNKIIFFDEVHMEKSINYYYPVQLEKSIMNNLQTGNDEKVKDGLKTLKKEMNEKQSLSYENVFRIYNRLLDEAVDLLFEANIALDDIFDSKYNIHEELAKRETVDAISLWMENLFIQFIKSLKQNTPHNTKVELAIQYMEGHFGEDLSIDYIAETVGLNPAYLSRIFKHTTGKTILEYLTLLRINQSKELLKESKFNIHDIAQKVGYNNANSFIRFFKKYEGITPGEYRKT